MIRRFASLILAAAVISACGTGAEPTDLPRVDLIDEAVSRLGRDLEYFEVAADASGVTLVVRLVEVAADDGASGSGVLAEVHRFEDGTLARISEPVEADGAFFSGAEIDLDPSGIFDRVLEELDAATVLDLAIQGSPDGQPVYDARVRGSRGGILLVLLGADGRILGVQAE
ncbi:MAG: hypothetical protein ACO3R3_09975 [Ilumatobacteraceae bacterium]